MGKMTARAEMARRLLQLRALRWDYFQSDLFDEHAWNILLVLFIAEASGRETNEALAMREASVPPTIGLRWITHLEKSGLVERGSDATILYLTAHSRAEMGEYLDEAERVSSEYNSTNSVANPSQSPNV